MNKNVKKLVGIGLFTAIVVVLQLLGGGLRFSAFSITVVLVPIVVGSAVYGWYAGPWLGLCFGAAVLLSGDAAAFMAVDPLATVLVVLVKGCMCGLAAGLLYKLLERFNRTLAVFGAAIICPVVNTGVFLLGCYLFFMPTITQWATDFGFSSAGNYMIFGLTGINFLIELAVNIVLSPVIVRLIGQGKK